MHFTVANFFGRFSVCWSVALVLLLLATSVQALPRGVTKVTEVEGIAEYRLKNGLTVLLFPDQSKETVTVNITYRVGSKHEKYGETGMAHLLEHLLFKGSKKHRNIPQELSERGAKPNGTTWIDRTNYYETFAATDDNIEWALDLEADRMVNSFIAQEDLDSEMTVVRNEFERTENSPFRVLMQRMMAASYMWHNNGKPTIGARADIENVSIERLRDFYEKYYQPDNAVLTIAGKFDEQAVLKKVNKKFGKISAPKRTLPPLYTTEPAQDGEKKVVVRRVGDTQLLAAAYHIPAGSHPDYAAIEVLGRILGDTPRGRLHKGLVEQDLAVATYAFPFELEDPGLLFFAAQLEEDADMEKARDAFFRVLESIDDDNAITEAEVERAKAAILKQIDLAFNSSEHIAILLSEYIGMGDWRLLFLTRDRIEAVTKDAVQGVADAYLHRNNRTEGQFYPTDEPQRIDIPDDQDLAAMLEGYTGREGVSQGESFDPSFDNIQKRTQLQTLASGAQVALLPKKTRGEAVALRFSMQFGDVESLAGKATLAELVAEMLMRGTEQHDRDQLNDRLDELKAAMSISGGASSVYGEVETTRENLVKVIHLLGEVLKEPSFSAAEFDQLVTSHIAGLEASRQVPQAIVSREMTRYFSPFAPGHPEYAPTLDEKIAALNAVELKQLAPFQQRFYAADHMQIAVVGDFDKKAVEAALKKEFGGWNGNTPHTRIPHPYVDLPTIDKQIDTPDKDNAAMVAMLALPVGRNHADAPALEMAAYIFGGGFLNSRLAERLRQKDGLSYSASAWVSLSQEESRGEFGAFAIFAPQNREAVESGIREELQRLIAKGVTEEELEAAKSGMLQKERVSRSDKSNLASTWVGNLYLDRTMTWHKQRQEAIKALTTDEVGRVAKKYLAADALSFVLAGDLSKAANN